MSFIWTWKNWKDVIRDELWYQRWQASREWCITSLNGDLDAHRAYIINNYLRDHLPWKKIKTWLRLKKKDFLEKPPHWLSPKWLNLIPPEIRNDIWNTRDMKELEDAMKEADRNHKEARERASEKIF